MWHRGLQRGSRAITKPPFLFSLDVSLCVWSGAGSCDAFSCWFTSLQSPTQTSSAGFTLCPALFWWAAAALCLKPPLLGSYCQYVLQSAVCLPKWTIIQHFDTQQTSIAAEPGRGEEDEEGEGKWSRNEPSQLLCHLSLSWLHSWYVYSNFLSEWEVSRLWLSLCTLAEWNTSS